MHKVNKALQSASLLAGLLACVAAVAQPAFPAKPLRFVVPSAPGGNADILTRVLAEGMARGLAQPVLVDNRAGGSAIIGTGIVAKAPADGHTLLMISPSHAVNPALFAELPYDTQRDFTPIGMVGDTPILLVANPRVPVADLRELLALARTRTGSLHFAYQNNGSQAHLGGELINALAGVRLLAVPYKGAAQAINDVIGGTIELAFPSVSAVLPQVKSGKLRALGITSARRSALVPDIPTLGETLAGYQCSIWSGVIGPAGLPRPVVTRLNAEMQRVLSAPEVKAKLEGMGVDVDTGTPDAFGAFIEAEIRKWGRVIREAGIRPD